MGKSPKGDLTLSPLPNYVCDIFDSAEFAISLPQVGDRWDRSMVKAKMVRKSLVIRFLVQQAPDLLADCPCVCILRGDNSCREAY